MTKEASDKSLESWIWDAACSIRGAKEAPKFKDFILPLIFTKRLCDVFDDELNRIAEEVGSRAKAFKLVEKDHKLVRFYLPLKPDDPDEPVWSVIRKLTGKIGESLTTYLHDIAKANPLLEGHHRPDGLQRHHPRPARHRRRPPLQPHRAHQREAPRPRATSRPTSSAAATSTSSASSPRAAASPPASSSRPPEVARIMALIMDPEPGMSVYDPCCGSAGLLIACEHVLDEKMKLRSKTKYAPLKMHGQEYVATTWAMANMNMIIHDMEGRSRSATRSRIPSSASGNRLQTFDRVVSNPMWNQDWFKEEDYDADELGRFPQGAGFPGAQSADWGWAQHILASLNDERPGRDRPRHRRRLPRQRQRQQEQGKDRPPVVRRAGPDRGRDLPARKPVLQHQRPGHPAFLNKAKPKDRKGKLFLVNASQVVEKGDPKNFIPAAGIERIATAFKAWQEEEKFAKIVTREQMAKEDYNISPCRYIHVADAEEHRPIAEILEELEALDAEAEATRPEEMLRPLAMNGDA